MKKLTVFLPCRSGSQRVAKKNTRTFANNYGGLLSIKINQLLNTINIEKIVVSTDDILVKKIALEFSSKKIIIDNRPSYLASSETSTDDLITYLPQIIESEHIMWTHVTSPFITSEIYFEAINKYFECISTTNFDSLMSVTPLRTFLWNENGPINYDIEVEKWPRTQTLSPVYEINSGFFIANRSAYINQRNRIGEIPYLFKLDRIESFDIDWPEDFKIGELLYKEKFNHD
jgi:CMP-N-acetylneuraminic acid synthetase